MLFRTRHVEDSSGSKIAEENAEENDDGIEDQFVSLWLDVEDEASALGGDEVVDYKVNGRLSFVRSWVRIRLWSLCQCSPN